MRQSPLKRFPTLEIPAGVDRHARSDIRLGRSRFELLPFMPAATAMSSYVFPCKAMFHEYNCNDTLDHLENDMSDTGHPPTGVSLRFVSLDTPVRNHAPSSSSGLTPGGYLGTPVHFVPVTTVTPLHPVRPSSATMYSPKTPAYISPTMPMNPLVLSPPDHRPLLPSLLTSPSEPLRPPNTPMYSPTSCSEPSPCLIPSPSTILCSQNTPVYSMMTFSPSPLVLNGVQETPSRTRCTDIVHDPVKKRLKF